MKTKLFLIGLLIVILGGGSFYFQKLNIEISSLKSKIKTLQTQVSSQKETIYSLKMKNGALQANIEFFKKAYNIK